MVSIHFAHTKDIERKAIIKKAKKTIPNDLKLDFRFKTCFVEMINPQISKTELEILLGSLNLVLQQKILKALVHEQTHSC